MKLKYYLRGIGVGVVLTAIIMGIALGRPSGTMSDAEVIRRAKQLGMVEEGKTLSALSEMAARTEEKNETNDSSSDTEMDEKGEETSEEIDQSESSTGEQVPALDEAQEEGENSSSEVGASSESIKSPEDIKLSQDNPDSNTSTESVQVNRESENPEGNSPTPLQEPQTTETVIQNPDEIKAEEIRAAADDIQNEAAQMEQAQSEMSLTQGTDIQMRSNNDITTSTVTNNNGTDNIENIASGNNGTENNVQSTSDNITDMTVTSEGSAAGSDISNTNVDNTNSNYVVVVIPGGSESDTCARILREAGIIEDGVAFNRYLVNAGLDRKIRSGTKQIPKGASFDEIAAAITK